MKYNLKYLIIKIFIFIYSINCCLAQDQKVYPPSKKIYNDKEVYNLLMEYGIQDTFFTKKRKIKENHTILNYMTFDEIKKYGEMHKKGGLKRLAIIELNSFNKDVVKVKNLDEWFLTLKKYPAAFDEYKQAKTRDGKFLFEEVIAGNKVIVMRNGWTTIVLNSAEELREYDSASILRPTSEFKKIKALIRW
jgi:hypothetical protein